MRPCLDFENPYTEQCLVGLNTGPLIYLLVGAIKCPNWLAGAWGGGRQARGQGNCCNVCLCCVPHYYCGDYCCYYYYYYYYYYY